MLDVLMSYGAIVAQALESRSADILIFMLSIFLGYSVVSGVSCALHAPLMGLTNAVSSIIFLSAMAGLSLVLEAGTQGPFLPVLGFFLLSILGVNIFGGLLITHRMLSLFQKKQTTSDHTWRNAAYIGGILALASLPLSLKAMQTPLLLCLLSVGSFIAAFSSLSSLSHAPRSIPFACLALLCASLPLLVPLYFSLKVTLWVWGAVLAGGGLGSIIAYRVQMTALPQLMAAFHSLVGLAATLLSFFIILAPHFFVEHLSIATYTEIFLSVVIGAITFSGSLIAFLKLENHKSVSGNLFFAPYVRPGLVCIGLLGGLVLCGILFVVSHLTLFLWLCAVLSVVLGALLVRPIGGADMPVVISVLNSYSGWAAAALGFSLHQPLLIIVGAVVGSSGLILSYVMCAGMNRSLLSVLGAGFRPAENLVSSTLDTPERPAQLLSATDSAFMLGNSQSVLIIPGYGMAVAQAQYALREMADLLKQKGITVRYGIHPVAGRMPGHMNVLLAEAHIPYEDIFEFDDINADMAHVDTVFVIGANDITNPSAKDPSSPIYGMPIFDVQKAKQVLFVKRSLASGYAGIDNPLFYAPKTFMVLGDAKKVCEAIIKNL